MKAVLLAVHRQLGLLAATFLLVQALSGLTLVFGPQLAELLDPAGMVSSPGAVDLAPARLLAKAEARYPGYHVSQLVFPATADGTYLVQLADRQGERRFVSLDRHSGEVRREGGISRFPVLAARDIHDQWLAGRFGTVGISLTGLSLLLIAISGLGYWWPRRAPMSKSLAVKWHLSPRIVMRQLHRTTGVIASALLGFMAVTGLLMEVPRILAPAPANWTTSVAMSDHIEPALALATRRFPGRPVRNVFMVGPSVLAIFLHAPERNPMADHRVIVDTARNRILSARSAFQIREAWVVALPLHSGRALGVAGQLLVLLIGLALVTLAVTGPLMWAQARRSRCRAAPPKRRPEAIPFH